MSQICMEVCNKVLPIDLYDPYDINSVRIVFSRQYADGWFGTFEQAGVFTPLIGGDAL